MAKPAAGAPIRRTSPDHRFRAAILSAVADGHSPAEMSLQLTLQDVSLLARDRSIPVADLSYAGGVMRFLGVPIQKGGVDVSVLNLDAS